MVYVTQEMDEVVGADRVVALEGGSVVYAGAVDGLFGDVALVRRLGLGLPAAGELALELAAAGRALAPLPLTLDELVAALGSGDVSGAVRGMTLACRDVSFSYEEAHRPIPALRDVGFELGAGRLARAARRVRVGQVDAPAGDQGARRAGGRRSAPGRPARRCGGLRRAAAARSASCSRRRSCSCSRRRRGRTWPSARAASAGREADVTAAVDEALELVGLPPEQFGERHPYALSGGEQRRLALAGVLAMRPRLLLLDEPFVSLDPVTRRELAGSSRGSGLAA